MNLFSNKSVAIIDHVGAKAGLDFYNSSLLFNLEILGCRVKLYSNYISDRFALPTSQIFKFRVQENFLSILTVFSRYQEAFYECKNEGTRTVILHIFHFNSFDERILRQAKKFGLNVICIVHDVESLVGLTDLNRLKKICKDLVNTLIVHNEYSRDSLNELTTNEFSDKIKVIPHGHFLELPDPWISRSVSREQLGIKDENIILFFGMIKKSKGLDILLNALAGLKTPATLIIAGRMRKHAFDEYKKIIDERKLKNNIRLMINYVSNSDREKLMKAADVVVLPYRKVFQSGVMLMAMSYGLPVVCSDIPANQKIIQDKWNGMLFEDGNSASLAFILDELMNDESLRISLSINAKQYLSNEHDWKRIADSFYSLI